MCWAAVKAVVIGHRKSQEPLSAEDVGRVLKVDRIDQVLVYAFRVIEEAINEQQRRAEKREREDAGLAPPVGMGSPQSAHQPLDGLHATDCPQCARAA